MSDEKFQNKYRIKSARAMWHDYGGGAYFVTVCTKNREHFFGEIVTQCRDGACPVSTTGNDTANRDGVRPVSTGEPIMQLSPIGQCVYDNLQNITAHYPYAEIPLFVVMPNHWHAIIFIDGNKTPYIRRDVNLCRDGACPVSNENDTVSNENDTVSNENDTVSNENDTVSRDGARPVYTNEKMKQIDNYKGWLSVAVGGIKSAVTKFANENVETGRATSLPKFAWQTRFDDRIIRDQNMMNKVAEYIENNVARWNIDCFNGLTEEEIINNRRSKII